MIWVDQLSPQPSAKPPSPAPCVWEGGKAQKAGGVRWSVCATSVRVARIPHRTGPRGSRGLSAGRDGCPQSPGGLPADIHHPHAAPANSPLSDAHQEREHEDELHVPGRVF